jgi:hemoglobin/transferrin/lactoferrin receptor protein
LWYVERQNGVDVMVQNDDPNIQVGSAYKQWDLLQKFLYKQNDKVSHQLNFQYSSSSDVPRYDRLTQMSGTSPKFAEWYYGPQKRILAAYSLNLTNDKGIYDNARIGLSYQNIEESRVSRRFSGSSSKYRDSQIENLNVIALNADFSKQIKKNELRYGVEGLFNTVDSKGIRYDINADTTGKVASRYPDGGSTYQAMAVYLSHTYEASEELIIVDGIRYTNVNLKSKFIDTTFFPFPYNSYTQNNGALTGSLGVIFKPGKDWRINLTGSSAFRAPNVDDLSKVFESTNGNLIVPNPEIKPEFTYNLDLGIQKTFNKTITASLIGYYTWYQNLITTVPGTFNGQDSVLFNGTLSAVNTMDNASNAYLYGGSANLNADINEHFSITSSINYTYGRIKTDTTDYPLDHIAPVFGKTSFVLKMKRFRSEFFVMYSGWKSIKDYNMIGEDNFAFATPYGMPAWATLNLRSSFTVTKNLMLQASLENITDLHYRTFGSNFSAPGRNLVITLRGSF